MKLRFRLGTVYFAENWKYCNKIIFKCMNSTVRFIFNKNCWKKKFMSPVNNAWDLLNSVISLEILVTDNIPPDGVLLNKKKLKKEENVNAQLPVTIQMHIKWVFGLRFVRGVCTSASSPFFSWCMRTTQGPMHYALFKHCLKDTMHCLVSLMHYSHI